MVGRYSVYSDYVRLLGLPVRDRATLARSSCSAATTPEFRSWSRVPQEQDLPPRMKKLINGRRLGLVRRQVRPIGRIAYNLVATFENGTKVYMGVEEIPYGVHLIKRTTAHVYEYWQKGRR